MSEATKIQSATKVNDLAESGKSGHVTTKCRKCGTAVHRGHVTEQWVDSDMSGICPKSWYHQV